MTFLICYLKVLGIIVGVFGGFFILIAAVYLFSEYIEKKYGEMAGFFTYFALVIVVVSVPIALTVCHK